MLTNLTDSAPGILITKRTIALLIAITFLFAFVIWRLNNSSFFQNLWNLPEMNDTVMYSFCEKTITGSLVRQPINTFSNIIYLIVSVIILQNMKRNIHSISNNMNQFYEFFFGLLLLFVFTCSVLFHASLADIALKLDYTAVCAFAAFPSLYMLHHLVSKKKVKLYSMLKFVFPLVYLLTILLLILKSHHEMHSLGMLVLILIFFILSLIISIKNRLNRKYLFLSMASVCIAIIWFEFDKHKILCNVNRYLQPHSLWHVFIGLSAFYFYRYMQGQRNL